jgi:hypothetical protein
MKTNNLQNKRAICATLTGQTATAVATNTKAQGFRRQKKPIAAMYIDPLFENDDGCEFTKP